MGLRRLMAFLRLLRRSRSVRMLLLFLAEVLFLLDNIPYMAAAWRSSPLDSLNWIYIVWGGTLFLLGAVRAVNLPRRRDICWWGLPVILTALAMRVGAGFFDLNIGCFLSDLLGLLGALFFFGGWHRTAAAIPAFLVLLLGGTAFPYLLGYLAKVPDQLRMLFRLTTAVVATGWMVVNIYSERLIPGVQTSIFILATALVMITGIANLDVGGGYPPLPLYSQGITKDLPCRQVPLNRGDKEFFGNSQVWRRVYLTPEGSVVGGLMVSPMGNGGRIHPPGYCLRSSGQVVFSEELREMELSGEKRVQVQEIRCVGGGRERLVWAWYGNPQRSTGSFIVYRLALPFEPHWQSVQLMVRVKDGDVRSARRALTQVMESLVQP